MIVWWVWFGLVLSLWWDLDLWDHNISCGDRIGFDSHSMWPCFWGCWKFRFALHWENFLSNHKYSYLLETAWIIETLQYSMYFNKSELVPSIKRFNQLWMRNTACWIWTALTWRRIGGLVQNTRHLKGIQPTLCKYIPHTAMPNLLFCGRVVPQRRYSM